MQGHAAGALRRQKIEVIPPVNSLVRRGFAQVYVSWVIPDTGRLLTAAQYRRMRFSWKEQGPARRFGDRRSKNKSVRKPIGHAHTHEANLGKSLGLPRTTVPPSTGTRGLGMVTCAEIVADSVCVEWAG